MKNGQELIDILAEFEAKSTSKFVGYFHGHQHMDKVYNKGELVAFNSISLCQAFPGSDSQANTNNQVGFYVVSVDISKRQATLKPVGHATLTNVISY